MQRAPLSGLCVALLAACAAGQESRSPFEASTLIFEARDVRVRALLDWDGDGLQDVVGWESDCAAGWSACTRRVALAINLGDGTFGAPLTHSFSANNATTHAFATGRLGVDDGRDDFVFGLLTEVRIYASAAGTFAAPLVINTTGNVIDAAIVDVDGDGNDDLVVLSDLGVGVFDGVSSASLGSYPVTTSAGARLLLSDLDGDGDRDCVVAGSPGPSDVQVLWNQPTSLAIGPGFSTSVPVASFAAGDVDGDGDEDLVAFGSNAYSVLRNDGATLVVEPIASGGPGTHLVDVDLDGDLDGVACLGGSANTTVGVNQTLSEFHVSLNDGSGQFAPSVRIPALGADRLAGAADMDGDGDVDLVAGRSLFFQTDGFADPRSITPAFVPTLSDIVDFDDDGDRDYAWTPTVTRRNDGDGSWSSTATIILGTAPGTTYLGPGYVGDFDGDGLLDRIVEAYSGATFLDMRLLHGMGGGVLEDRGTVFIGGGVQASTVTDLTGDGGTAVDIDLDGDLDLITHSAWGSNYWTHVWLNDGTGVSTLGFILDNFTLEGVSDFDQSGVLDLVVSNSSGVYAARGLGGGTFGAPVAVSPSNTFFLGHLDDLRVSDVNLDGRDDLIMVLRRNDISTSSPQSRAYIYAKDASSAMTFYQFVPLGPVGAFPSPLTSEEIQVLGPDIDGDGDLDLVIGPTRDSAGRGWMIFERLNPLGIGPPTVQFFRANAFVDIDGDGDADALGPAELVRSRAIASGAYRQYAPGFPGTDGVTPTLGAVGPFRVNTPLEVRVTGALGGAQGLLVLGDQEANIPILGGIQYLNTVWSTAFVCGGAPGSVGAGSWTWSVGALPPSFAGTEFFLQAGVQDAAGPGGWARTNPIRATIGL